jgi:hypothetical protein
MKNLILVLLITLFTGNLYSQYEEKDTVVHLVQLLYTDNYTIISPEVLSSFPDNTLVESVFIDNDLYYRLLLPCKNSEEQVELYLKNKPNKNYKTYMIKRTVNDVKKMTRLYTFD